MERKSLKDRSIQEPRVMNRWVLIGRSRVGIVVAEKAAEGRRNLGTQDSRLGGLRAERKLC